MDHFVAWRGQQIHVADTGHGEPLLLVPGLGNNIDMWAPFMEQFRERRVIRLEAPGTGQSSTPAFPVGIPALAEMLKAILDDRQIEWADVVGFSYGGAVAQQFAYDYPERVRRLVLAATFCGVGAIPGSPAALMSLATPLRYYSPSYYNRTAAVTSGGVTGRDWTVRQWMIAARRSHPPSSVGYAMQLMGIMGWSSRGFLQHIPHETLVICGDDDPLVPVANGEMLARLIPRARLEVVERAGHLLLWDDAKNVSRLIRRFLNSETTDPTAPRRTSPRPSIGVAEAAAAPPRN
jgi:poly(3-hydroxyoctanoate) depolymerase